MDEADFRIVGHLFQHPLAGPQELARAVNLTRNAVARRFRMLQESALGLAFHAYPHQDLFALEFTLHLYAPEKPIAGKAINDVATVIGYDINHDGLHAVTTWRHPGTPRPAELDRLMGGPPLVEFTDSAPGPAAPYLTRLEWKVVAALLDEPRASLSSLARRTGLAPRTCARARDRLLQSKAVRVTATIREDHAEGLPVYRLYVQGRPAPKDVTRILGQDAIVSDQVKEGTVYFARAASLGSIMAAAEAMRKADNVEDVKLILSKDSGLARPYLRQLIANKMRG